MTNRKNSQMAQRNVVQSSLIIGFTLASLAGCNAVGSLAEADRVDYKSAGKAPALEVPPDLTQLQRENRYAIPETNRGTATASGFNLQQKASTGSLATVAPTNVGSIKVERAGSQRWLVVKQTPEVLWPQIKDFWQEAGFLINIETPDTGVMETDWAENRAKIPQDLLRRTLGKVLDSLYSTGERDKFRIRIERGVDGFTEIYLSHRGAQEVLVGQNKESSNWISRPSDPELEAEFLSRLMVRLGTGDGERAKASVVAATMQPSHAKLVKAVAGNYVEVDESFDRAWRRVGLALDRVGFTVEDRDRIIGQYFVRYIDQDADAQTKAAGDKNFLSKLFSFGSGDKTKAAQSYRVLVKAAGTISQVSILNGEGVVQSSPVADKILGLLNDQLK